MSYVSPSSGEGISNTPRWPALSELGALTTDAAIQQQHTEQQIPELQPPERLEITAPDRRGRDRPQPPAAPPPAPPTKQEKKVEAPATESVPKSAPATPAHDGPAAEAKPASEPAAAERQATDTSQARTIERLASEDMPLSGTKEEIPLDEPAQSTVAAILDEHVPLRTDSEWVDFLDRSLTCDRSEVDEQKIEECAAHDLDMRGAIEEHVATTIPPEEQTEYIDAVCRAAHAVSPQETGTIIDTVAEICEATPTLGLAKAYEELAHRWQETYMAGADIDIETALDREEDFTALLNALSGPSPYAERIPTGAEVNQAADVLMRLQRGAYNHSNQLYVARLRNEAILSVRRGTYTEASGEQFINSLTAAETAIRDTNDRNLVDSFLYVLDRYNADRTLPTEHVAAVHDRVWPAMRDGDPQVELLTNLRGGPPSISSSGELIYKALVGRLTPAHMHELMLRFRLTPTINAQRLLQNRADGITLNDAFPQLRIAVHRQEVGVHTALQAMVTFYETGNERVLAGPVQQFGEAIKHRVLYDVITDERSPLGRNAAAQAIPTRITHIDVIRRLAQNTRSVEEQPPQTSDPVLNGHLQKLYEVSLYQRRNQLGNTMQYVNDTLEQAMQAGRAGIEPIHIAALAWLEQAGFQILQTIDNFEDQLTAYRQPWFQEVVRFQELTASPRPYNAAELAMFMQQLSHASPEGAYQLLNRHCTANLVALAQSYTNAGHYFDTGILWTGTVASALSAMAAEWKPATTTVGARLRRELETPAALRNTGDSTIGRYRQRIEYH